VSLEATGYALSTGIRGSEGWVLLALANASTDYFPPFRAYPSVPTICDWADLGERTVQGALIRMKKAGTIADRGVSEHGTVIYEITAPAREGWGAISAGRGGAESAGHTSPNGSSSLAVVLGADSAGEGAISAGGTPQELLPPDGPLGKVIQTLRELAFELEIAPPTISSIKRAMEDYPDHDHPALARDLRAWCLDNPEREFKRIASLYRTFCKRERPGERSAKEKRGETYDRIVAETGFSMLPNTPREEG
jgi:hypothetical protein